MNVIPQDWIRERTSPEEIRADWSRRRKEHNWWTPPTADWCREWEAFTGTMRDGDELYHFCETAAGFPTEGYGDEGYVLLRDGVQIGNIFWVAETHGGRAAPDAVGCKETRGPAGPDARSEGGGGGAS